MRSAEARDILRRELIPADHPHPGDLLGSIWKDANIEGVSLESHRSGIDSA